jgi:integrase
MASIRKRKWKDKEAWVVDYTDQQGKRRLKTFRTKKEADAWSVTALHQISQGTHTAISASITVAQAADNWLNYLTGEGLERSTLRNYRQHVGAQIVPYLGREKLAKLTTPLINKYRDDLLSRVSRITARKVLVSLKSIIKDAQRRGDVAQNVAAGVSVKLDSRDKRKLQVGIDIPSPEEISRIINAASDKRRPLLLTLVFTGLRASELRGLRWQDIDLQAAELHVRQRADRFNVIGQPKSEAGQRTIPLGPIVVNALRIWKLQCKHDLVFPTSTGKPLTRGSLMDYFLKPAQVAAGVVDGNAKAKYAAHAFRHFYASWLINREQDGGLGLPIKTVQTRLGHSSITMTSDIYGHLFRSDDGEAIERAEKRLLGLHATQMRQETK